MPSVLAEPTPANSVLSTPKPERSKKPLQLRDITDVNATRKNIYDNVLEAVNSIGPLQNIRHTLQISNAHYVDPEDFDLARQKEAILTGKTPHRRIRGTWTLTDNETGQRLDKKDATIAAVPFYTNRGTFILNGTEYTLSNQMRLRPGIFVRQKENLELEAHVNPTQGAPGISHRYFLDPETGVFKINIGQAKLPLMPVLKALGVTEKELRNAWGDELVGANLQGADGKTINKLYARLVRKPDANATEETKAKAIADFLFGMKLDPEVTQQTLGRPHEYLTKDAILDTTKKLIDVSRGDKEPDDRDHLAFQTFHGPEDLLAERITRDKAFLRQLLWKASFRRNLGGIQPGVLTRQLHNTILHSGLGQALEEINNAELIDAQSRVTRLGEGGIGSIDAIPDESRNVSPSHLSFLDLTKVPESSKVGIDLRIANAVKKGTDGRLYAPFVNAKTGRTEYKTPQDLVNANVAFPGEFAKNKPYVATVSKGQIKYLPKEEVEFEMPHMENAFSPLSNMLPNKSGIKGQRASMGARFLAQALPLENREAPLVQAGMPGQHMIKSFEDHYGTALGAVRAEQPGIVRKVTKDNITVQNNDGKKQTYPLYNSFAYARKTLVDNYPSVKVGDKIGKGQLLASSNFTDNKGTAALGINAKVAFIPFHGKSFEDAIVISNAFAKKLSSIHMYQHTQDWNKNIKKGLNSFISLFPTEYEKSQLQNMDKDGVVKPGTVVNYGDPLILAAEEQERTQAQIHRGRKPTFSNKTVLWEHHQPGIVTDVANATKDVNVVVKSLNPTQVADKLTPRFASKGVIGEIIPDDQMPVDENGEPFEVLMNPLGIISRINPALVAEVALSKIAKKTGQPYKLEDFSKIDDLMKFTKGELLKNNVKDKETVTDPSTGRKIPNVLSGYQYFLKLHHTSESKSQARGFGDYTCFDSQTEALTARGWINWPEIKDDDLFAVPVNNKWTYEKATKITKENYTGELVGFSGRYVDYLVTPNHRLYYYTEKLPEKRFERADVLSVRARFDMVQAGWILDGSNEEYIVINPASINPRAKTIILPINLYAELMGWWLSEGCVSWHPERDEYKIRIYQSFEVNKDKLDKICACISACGFKYCFTRTRGKITGISFNSATLCNHLKQFGKCRDKFIPRNLLNACFAARKILFDSLIAGDGHYYAESDNWTYTTLSKQLADNVQELALSLGLSASVKNKDRLFKYPHKNFLTTVWTVGIGHHRSVKIKNWPGIVGHYRRLYSGTVYCATLPSGLVYIRRNGKCLLTGNSENVPSKGVPGASSKKIALLETNALLSNGATEFLRDAHLIRGQKNENYWQAFMSGFRPPEPEVPLLYRKFVDSLKGSGINVVRDGRQLHVMALTDKDIDHLAGRRYIQNADTVDWKEGLKPKSGGLFDEALTGGHGGESRWSAIKLFEPMPNPVMEEPIRRMLGLTQQKFEDVVAGKEAIENYGTGTQAIQKALEDINIKKAIAQAETEVKGSRSTVRDAAVRKLQYLRHAERLGIHPSEWILHKVPVIPPIYRPVSVMRGTGGQLISDANYLYKEVFDANDVLKELHGQVADLSNEKLNLYKAFKAVTGLGDPIQPKNQERNVKGLLGHIFGSSPKWGTVQRQLLGASVDLVGRSVIIPNPEFDMDSVGIPEEHAWETFKPFIIRRLVQRGVPRIDAARAFTERLPIARNALLEETKERPVVITRAPALHRYNLIGGWAKLVKGDALQTSPIVVSGLAADYDGDQMNYHVPASEEARREVIEKMLPSRNLLSVSEFKPHYLPSQEYQGGLYHASTAKSEHQRPAVFRSAQDAIKAYNNHLIGIDTPVEILQH